LQVLLDESVPRQLVPRLKGHDVRTVPQMGWASSRNGDLLRLANAAGFSALITVDRSLEYQQDVPRSGLGLVVLLARSTKPDDILPLAPAILDALTSLQPGQAVHVGDERLARRTKRR
jgi:hypothetical protein